MVRTIKLLLMSPAPLGMLLAPCWVTARSTVSGIIITSTYLRLFPLSLCVSVSLSLCLSVHAYAATIHRIGLLARAQSDMSNIQIRIYAHTHINIYTHTCTNKCAYVHESPGKSTVSARWLDAIISQSRFTTQRSS